MSDSYVFRSKRTGETLVIFGVSLADARQCITTSDKKDVEYLGKNVNMPKSTLARVTDKQYQKNKENFDRIMSGL